MASLGFDEMCGTPCKPQSHSSGIGSEKPNTTSGIRVGGNQVMADVTSGKADVSEATRADVIGQANDTNGSGVKDVRADVSSGSNDGGSARANEGVITDGRLNGEVKERVSVWERLNPKIMKGDGTSFATIVGSVPQPELEFFPVEKEKNSRVHIPMAMTKGMANKFSTVLLGYFLGPRIPFPSVIRAVKNAWGKFGFRDAMVNDHGYFFFRFNDQGGCMHVADSSPLMISGVPLFVTQWNPSKGLFKPVHTTCPLWVKLYNVPLVAFNKEGISRIASAIGVPLRMDACTASTCDNLWGRTSFAKVMVEVWATGELKKEIEVVIPRLSGDGEDVVKVVVEYDWEPSQCSICKIFGHRDSVCSKREIRNENENSKVTVDKDGYQRPKRNQWRPKTIKAMPNGHKAETSNVNKENLALDTMVGVGNIKKVNVEPKLKDKINQEAAFVIPNSKPNAQTGEGEFCTLNAGRTPEGKDGVISKGDNSNKGESLPSNIKQTEKDVTILTKEPNGNNSVDRVDRGKVNAVDSKSAVQMQSKPLKSILKNPSNRFSALIDKVIAFDEQPIGVTNSAGRKMDIKLKIGENHSGRKGEDGSNLHPKV